MYRLVNRLPFFYGWTILFAAGSSMVVRNAAASLTLAVFIFPISEDLGWSRTLLAGAASLVGLVATVASPAVGWALVGAGAGGARTASAGHGYQATCVCRRLGNYHTMADLSAVQAGTNESRPRVGREYIALADYHGLIDLLIACGTSLPEASPIIERLHKLWDERKGVLEEA